MKKSKRRTLLIIGIMLIISLVIGISYAYWKKTVVQTNQNSITSTCFNISFKEDTESINLDKIYPITDEEGKSLSPYTFTITNECDRYTSFQINLEILDTTTLNDKYIKVALNESTPEILTNKEVVEKTLEDAVTSYKLEKGYLDSNESKTYNLRLWMDESTPALEETMNKLFSSKITVIASYVEEIPTFCEMYSETGACEILAKGETEELKFDNTVDNNLRYIGANPNNYVSFNNELWRIIGVMNNIDDGTGKKETRLKIIRNESIGGYSWDNKASGTGSSTSEYGSNDWSDSALQKVLNEGAYWNRTSGECPYGSNGATIACDFNSNGLTNEAKEMIENALWHLGGTASYTSSSNGLTSHWYTYERGTTVYNERPTEWIGKIGLMYPSDYGYATSGGATTNREACLNTALYSWNGSGVRDCKNNDWLYNSSKYQWTMTPFSSYSYSVFRVYSDGFVGNYRAYFSNSVLSPALYLSSNVKISGGEGTSDNPYVLSL